MKFIIKRHGDSLRSFRSKGHSFTALMNSSLNNFMMKPNTLMTDSIVRLTIKARTNSPVTGSLLSIRNRNANNNENNSNLRCSKCGQIETLNHILNGCMHKKYLYTKRHDAVQNILRDYLTNTCRMNVHANQTIRGCSSERLEGGCASLKLYLWWNENHLFIAEFTIPYGMLTNADEKDNNPVSTLTIRRNEKTEKYSNLVEECKKQLHCDATLIVCIVSSLGALPHEALDELKKVAISDKEAGKLARRMVADTSSESMNLYYRSKCNNCNQDNNNSNDNDDEETGETEETE